MTPIARGRAVELGDIKTVAHDGGTDEHEMAMLVVFDSMSDFRNAVKYGSLQVGGLAGNDPPPR